MEKSPEVMSVKKMHEVYKEQKKYRELLAKSNVKAMQKVIK